MQAALLFLFACSPDATKPDDSNPGLDSTDTAGGDDSAEGESGSESGSSGETADTGTPLPYGDNLTPLGAFVPFSNMEALGVLAMDGDLLVMCAGVYEPAVFDVSDPTAPTFIAEIGFAAPSSGPRCQHLAALGSTRIVVTHHGDEMGDPWVGVVDLADPTHPLPLWSWAQAGVELEGVDTLGDTAWVAAHSDGLLTFNLATGAADAPTHIDLGGRNAYSVKVRGERVAVGTVEGSLVLLDTEGGHLGEVPLSGPARELLWTDDHTLYAACGASGIDRVDVDSLTVTAHTDGLGSSMDIAALPDGSLAVAAYSILTVYDPDLNLVGTEDPAATGEDVAILTLDSTAAALYVGEWQHIWSFAWDPTVAAPDIRAEHDAITLPDADPGITTAYALLVRNDGPQQLEVTSITAGDASIRVSEATLSIAGGGVGVVELEWDSDGLALETTLTLTSNDPDEPQVIVSVASNSDRPGVGDPLPPFIYAAVNGTGTYDSTDLGGPALLSYFATF